MAGDDGGGAGGDWQLSCGQVRERGARLLASGQWADCSFRPGAGQRAAPVKAHRLILAMASPVFQAMFYGPLAEGDAPIPVPDVQPDVFNKLLQYVYTDDVELENYEIAIEVYYAAEKYMLPHLQVVCKKYLFQNYKTAIEVYYAAEKYMLPHLQITKYLLDNLVPQNACAVYEFANFIEDKELESKSLKIIQKNTKQALAPGSSFEDLALGTAIHIFSLNKLTIDSELDLLAAAERYVLAWQKRVNKKADLNISSSDDGSENVSTSNIIDKNTAKIDKIECNGNSNGDGQDENEATAKNQAITLSDTKPLQPVSPEVVNKARSEATFRFTFDNVSKMEGIVFSPPFYVRNLPWKIWVEPVDDEGQKYLGFGVNCNAESKSITWSCKALIEYRLISHKANIEPYYSSRKYYYDCFSSVSTSRGYSNFMAWNDVLDPEKGYVEDDEITLEVRVIAEPPQGLSWYTKQCIGDVGIEDEEVRELLRQIRFLTLTREQIGNYRPKLKLLTTEDILGKLMSPLKDTVFHLPSWLSTKKFYRRMEKRNVLLPLRCFIAAALSKDMKLTNVKVEH